MKWASLFTAFTYRAKMMLMLSGKHQIITYIAACHHITSRHHDDLLLDHRRRRSPKIKP